MTADTPQIDAQVPMRSADVTLTVGNRRLRLRLDVPAVPVESVALLPLFRSLADTLVDIASDEVRARGLSISCRKGCGACCRQLVPISEMEVAAIRRLVAALPEPRRSEVVARFEQAVTRLGDAGILDALRHPESIAPKNDAVESLGLAYFAQRVACPFLEDESCSIHAERPLACREYLVTSPAANCADPSPERIDCVPMPVKVSRAVRGIVRDRPARWIPMILALEWPLPDEQPAEAGTAMVAKAFSRLTGAKIPEG